MGPADAAAIVISLLALALTLYEARATRLHNRLSVAPTLTDDFDIVPTQPRASITLKNCGLGPAMVVTARLRIDKQKRQDLGINNWEELTLYLGLAAGTTYDWPHGGSIIPAGGSLDLVSTPLPEYSPERAKIIRAAFRRLRFEIEYTSMYRERPILMAVDGELRYPAEPAADGTPPQP